ncbi:MAG: DUF4230 domain-containing protein [Leptolyngbyaceae cyanobacterium CSU_1_3]|nr:DUF4230 domain-containing protein [Leptolyngbyaceae cyanobacterium CSU_1_3]
MQRKDRQRPRHRGFVRFKHLGLMVTGGVLMIAAVTTIGVVRSGDHFLGKVSTLFSNPQPAPKVEARSIVIQQIRDASELTTAVFTMEAVVPTQQDATIGGLVVGRTKLLYIAYGEVRAGVDLSSLTPESVQVVGETLRLRLPPPQILDSKIDITRSKVYDYNRGVLGLGPDVAPALQELAQKEALQKIQATATADGILQRANDRAKLVVTQMIKVPGIQEVLVETQPPAPILRSP